MPVGRQDLGSRPVQRASVSVCCTCLLHGISTPRLPPVPRPRVNAPPQLPPVPVLMSVDLLIVTNKQLVFFFKKQNTQNTLLCCKWKTLIIH